MKERPILFSAPMVRAILEGRKTVTRRVDLKFAPVLVDAGFADEYIRDPGNHCACPYGVEGDRLWVRETWAYFGGDEYLYQKERGAASYRADIEWGGLAELTRGIPGGRWRPSIHMPRWASRITLEVKSVRAERLQEIDGEDVPREGVTVPRCGCERCGQTSEMCPATATDHIDAFAELWESINGKRPGCAWSDNPWVWRIEFARIEVSTEIWVREKARVA